MPPARKKASKKPPGRKKGAPKTGGRKPGSVNVKSVEIKAAITAAFDALGGVNSLVKWGRRNPTEFYKIWSKLLPKEITTPPDQPLRVQAVTEIIVRSRQEADAVIALNEHPPDAALAAPT